MVCGNVQGRKDIMLAEYGGWYKAAAVDRSVNKVNSSEYIIYYAEQQLHYCLSSAMHGQNINLPVCVCVCLSVCVCHTFCQLAYRSDPSTDFYS